MCVCTGIGSDRFVGRDLLQFVLGDRRVFGGQVVAQALSSAVKTADPKFIIRSVHCHYIRPVIGDSEVIYHVARLKDGRSISTREVKADQSEKTVFSCLMSLTAEEEEDIGLAHTDHAMPQVHPIPNNETDGMDIDPRCSVSIAHFPVKFHIAYSVEEPMVCDSTKAR